VWRLIVLVLGGRGRLYGRDLDHPDFRPLWRRIRDLGVFVLLHPPMRPVGLDRTGDYFLNNLISYPVDTTIAAAQLLFSGIFQKLLDLKICLAHSSGFLPFVPDWSHGSGLRRPPRLLQVPRRAAIQAHR
jgi:predicted TIM-barrel fold metal-dependent hydrolase